MSARYIVADVFDGLATLEPGSVDLVMTSPPFLALRSYLPADHPDKAWEIGSEATPGAFIDRMLDVVEACARVLAPHGSLVFELGDTYAGSGGAGGDYNEGGLREGQDRYGGSKERGRTRVDGDDSWRNLDGYYETRFDGAKGGRGWPLDKSKVLIPQLFAIALAYGFNPLTGRVTEPWRVRNTVAWCRPNPPVGRDGDKFRPATSFLTVACKARDRYWDGDAVRKAQIEPDRVFASKADVEWNPTHGAPSDRPFEQNPAGAPLLDWWEIPTQPYRGSHYATYPDQLVVPVVKAMCPARVCRVCGEPSRRIVEITQEREPGEWSPKNQVQHRRGGTFSGGYGDFVPKITRDAGWSDCNCPPPYPFTTADEQAHAQRWRPGVVLDPFAGSGTTLAVATGHGFDAIGIDLDARNAELAYERIGGLFLTIETLDGAAASRPIRELETL